MTALRQARALVAEEASWTRSAPARRWKAPRAHGEGEWEATDPSARRWCAAGALCAVSGRRRRAPGFDFLEPASLRLFGMGIGRANDDRRLGHADVLRCFDAAIAAASS